MLQYIRPKHWKINLAIKLCIVQSVFLGDESFFTYINLFFTVSFLNEVFSLCINIYNHITLYLACIRMHACTLSLFINVLCTQVQKFYNEHKDSTTDK